MRYVIWLTISGLSLWGAAHSPPLVKYSLVFIAVSCLVSAATTFFGRLTSGRIMVGPRLMKHLAAGAWFLCFGLYLLLTPSGMIANYFGVAMVLFGSFSELQVFVELFLVNRLMEKLRAAWRKGEKLGPDTVYALTVGVGRWATRELHRLRFKLPLMIRRSRIETAPLYDDAMVREVIQIENRIKRVAKSACLVFRRIAQHRLTLRCVDHDDLIGFDANFRSFVESNSSAIIAAARLGDPRFSRMLTYFERPDEQTAQRVKQFVDGLPRIVRVYNERLRREYTDGDRAFWEIVQNALGPVIMLLPGKEFINAEDIADVHCRGYDILGTVTANRHNTSARIVTTLIGTALPLAAAERALPAKLRCLERSISHAGLAPFADAYLRFRLSKNNVERFLCLIDCFEVIVKYSVFTLGACSPEASHNLNETLVHTYPRPTLGNWVAILDNQVRGTNGHEGKGISHTIVCFWRAPLEGAPLNLIDASNGAGLAWKGEIPRSYLGWLQWFTWFRNVTKGHGSIHEGWVAPLWMGIHETLLHVADQLSPLLIESTLEVSNDRGELCPMSGWLRGDRRTSRLDHGDEELADSLVLARMRVDGDSLDMSGLVRFKKQFCLTWNRRDDQRDDFVDYASGQILQVDEGSSSPVPPGPIE